MKRVAPSVIILAAYAVISNWTVIAAHLSPIDYDPAVKGEVVLYATSWCGYCRKTRELLSAYNIEYTELDVERSQEGKRRFDQLGGHGVPVVTVGSTAIHGYNPDALIETLRQ